MEIVDNTFTINHKDPTETLAIGNGDYKVPENMTNLCNYILRLNPNHLKESNQGSANQGRRRATKTATRPAILHSISLVM